MVNSIVWFDIPVQNIDRACEFYSLIFGTKINKETHDNFVFAPFPHKDGDVSGCLVEDQYHKASNHGVLIYLNVDGKIDKILDMLEQHGGIILQKKEQIGPWGYRAIVLDSEQNRIALHSYS